MVSILREADDNIISWIIIFLREETVQNCFVSKKKKSLAENVIFENLYFYITTHTLKRRIHRQLSCTSAIV